MLIVICINVHVDVLKLLQMWLAVYLSIDKLKRITNNKQFNIINNQHVLVDCRCERRYK